MAGEVKDIQWEEPPEGFDESGAETRRRFADALRERPGQWGVIAVYPKDKRDAARQYARLINNGGTEFWKDASGGHFEGAAAPADVENPDACDIKLYARFVPMEGRRKR